MDNTRRKPYTEPDISGNRQTKKGNIAITGNPPSFRLYICNMATAIPLQGYSRREEQRTDPNNI